MSLLYNSLRAIVILLGILIIILTVANYIRIIPIGGEGNICETYSFRTKMCCYNCQELGKEFYRLNGGGYVSYECWCREGNNTVRIW